MAKLTIRSNVSFTSKFVLDAGTVVEITDGVLANPHAPEGLKKHLSGLTLEQKAEFMVSEVLTHAIKDTLEGRNSDAVRNTYGNISVKHERN